ncbi:hypothetical protein LTS18_009636 [Coniosporium uncinatum]|uniref:Uncharacterized protein n=1 Tax=Coniosporium uncinatum TaxID=93489 RepID=A0ACC3DA63_9PEZI|nr:hypothetical protein LTS18_009636 [Coniosporium uncinatum]
MTPSHAQSIDTIKIRCGDIRHQEIPKTMWRHPVFAKLTRDVYAVAARLEGYEGLAVLDTTQRSQEREDEGVTIFRNAVLKVATYAGRRIWETAAGEALNCAVGEAHNGEQLGRTLQDCL